MDLTNNNSIFFATSQPLALVRPNHNYFSIKWRTPIAVILMLTISVNLHALTLNEAVNAQLETVSAPCDRLLGTDPASVLTDGLANLCARAVPLGSTPQSTGGGAASLSDLSSSSTTKVQRTDAGKETQIGSKWTLFFTADTEKLNRDVTDAEDGFDSSAWRFLAGTTYALNARTDIGLALTTQHHDGDYTNGGDFKAKTNGIRFLATRYISQQVFVQASAGYDAVSSQRARAAIFEEYFNGGLVFSREGKPSSDFSYNQTELSILSGYNYTHQNMTVTPQLGINWLNTDYGTYSETGDSGLELTFHDDQRESLQSSLGVQTTIAISNTFGVTIPQLDLHWVHEFADKSRRVNVSFTQDTRAKQFTYDTEAGDRNYFELGAGTAFVFAGGNQAFIRAQTLLGHDFYDNYVISAGLNIEL
jgi:hypothetical protein